MNRTALRRQRLYTGIGLIALVALSGCASLGGNVRGSFSCAAPDGICAPSSSIDDRALALISGDSASEAPAPASDGVRRPAPRSNRADAGRTARPTAGGATRTQERVLRIVFQPYIDDRGRLHEASAVHAVVAQGEWQGQALLASAVRPGLASGTPVMSAESLADAVDRVDPSMGEQATTDPDAPDPAAVAAARARRADPVAAIKADVAARLAPKTDERNAGPRTAASADSAVRPAQMPVSAPAPVAPAPQSAPPKSSSAQQAVDRVKAAPAYRAAAENTATQARGAAENASAQPNGHAVRVHGPALGFPATVDGED
ncbi:TraV family lipoprotein [Sphingomonas sp.]|uniref:TraV family lipoprotein n=1 Tax=Sphingomonas sp. TaxID=28214 RepID=UPI00307E0EBB